MGLADLIHGNERPQHGSRMQFAESPCQRHGCLNLCVEQRGMLDWFTPRFCSDACKRYACSTCDTGVSGSVGGRCVACVDEWVDTLERGLVEPPAPSCAHCGNQENEPGKGHEGCVEFLDVREGK